MRATIPTGKAAESDALPLDCAIQAQLESELRDLARLAGQLCFAPMAVVALRPDLQFTVCVGFDPQLWARDTNLLGELLTPSSAIVVKDASIDERFATSTLVEPETGVRFLAGVPLRSAADTIVGSVWVMDTTPRLLDANQLASLEILARCAVAMLQSSVALATERRTLAEPNDEAANRPGGRALKDALSGLRDISERRGSEHILRESQERFRQLADNIEAMFWIREAMHEGDEHPNFVYASRAYETITGRSLESLFAHPASMTDAIVPEDREQVHMSRLQSNECRSEVEFRLRRADGAIRWIRGRSFPIRDADGRVHRVAGISEDITERKTAEETLQQFFDLSMDLLCIANFEGYFLQLSHGWSQALGWSLDELKSRPFVEFVHPDDIAATVTEAQKLTEGALTINFENRYRCKDGSFRWLLWSATTSAEKHLFYAVARDITERKCAEDTLRHGASYDSLTDLPNRTALNERLTRLLGRTRHDPEHHIAVLYLDLDGFKPVNDTFGHAAGDTLLQAAARRLEAAVRPGDFVSRLGGDEFVVVLEDVGDGQVAQTVCERISDAFIKPFQIDGKELQTGISVGIAVSQLQHERPMDILRDADAHMYLAKAKSRLCRTK
jgi:diguanylate cyclase (GGDEF)-like protein/PAS domain S-box-containing protein